MTLQLTKATRRKTKIKLGLAGTSGSGKTYSALLLAKGLAGSWDKVAVIDTENGSADLYAHLGDYNTLTLTAPFTPERYIEAIKTAEDAGMEVIVIDSITHEWDGKGGCLEIVEQTTQGSVSKNSYTAWAKVTPRHSAFIQAILQSPAHIITTVRRKQDYEMGKDSNGKASVTKVGLKEITREGFEYELTVSFNLTQTHLVEVSKDRTGMFADKPEFVITEKTGKEIKKWTEQGVADEKPTEDDIERDAMLKALEPDEDIKPTKKVAKKKEIEDEPIEEVEDQEPTPVKEAVRPYISTPDGSKLSRGYFALATKVGITNGKNYVKDKFKLDSYADITREQLAEVYKELKAKETDMIVNEVAEMMDNAKVLLKKEGK